MVKKSTTESFPTDGYAKNDSHNQLKLDRGQHISHECNQEVVVSRSNRLIFSLENVVKNWMAVCLRKRDETRRVVVA